MPLPAPHTGTAHTPTASVTRAVCCPRPLPPGSQVHRPTRSTKEGQSDIFTVVTVIFIFPSACQARQLPYPEPAGGQGGRGSVASPASEL